MNHTIKGILIVAVITSMLVVGATTMIPLMQNSFAHKKSAEDRQAEEGLPVLFPGVPGDNTNTNTNTNTADSISDSSATAEDANNITNSALSNQNQAQLACAVAVTCPEGSTTVTPTPTPTPQTGTLLVANDVTCPQGFTCPQPSDFTMHVTGNNPNPISFAG